MLTQALLVDDSRSVLNFLKRHIEAEGLVRPPPSSTRGGDGLRAGERFRHRAGRLRNAAGWTASASSARSVRFPKFADIPIAMITSHADRRSQDGGAAGGRNRFPAEAAAERRDDGPPAEFDSAWCSRPQAQRSRCAIWPAKSRPRRGSSASERKRSSCGSRSRSNTATTTPASTRCGSPDTAASSPSSSACQPGSAATSISPPHCTTSARSPFPTTFCSSPAG